MKDERKEKRPITMIRNTGDFKMKRYRCVTEWSKNFVNYYQ